jgi:hypothetical protein
MNERELDRVLASVVDDGPIQAPDWVIEAALSEIPTTRQRGGSALHWRRPMFKPLALVVATALLAALLAIPFVGGAIGPSPTPTPSPTPSPASPAPLGQERPYTTSLFSPAIMFPLVRDGVTAFQVTETETTLTISPPGSSTDDLVLMTLDGTRVFGDGRDGDASSVDVLVQLLNERPGITAYLLRRPDVDQLASLPFAGQAVSVVVVTIDPAAAEPGSPLLSTSSGETLDVPDEPWVLWILSAPGSDAGDLLAVYQGSPGDHGNYARTFLALLETIRPATD